jgi:hypothetical protein
LEVWTAGGDGRWQHATVRDIAELSIGARLDVRELYESASEA